MSEPTTTKNATSENINDSPGCGWGCVIAILIIQIPLIVLKLCKVINWNWWIVLIPALTLPELPFILNDEEMFVFVGTKGVKKLQAKAEKGNVDAQYQLGYLYLFGKGTSFPANDALAAEWIGKAAESGHADAQNYLGYMYENGFGVTKNGNEAVKWYRKAAEQGVKDAADALKKFKFDASEEVNVDEQQGKEW